MKQEKNIKTRKFKDTKNSNKGITLIALVITIVVLIILAIVSIATLTGENGILTRATDSKTETEEAKEDELRRLTALEAATNLENKEYKDKNEDTVTIPAGFAVSQVEGENTIEDGLVIIDSKGNEFVWVPVDNYDEFVRHDFGNQNIKDEDFVTQEYITDKYYEPSADGQTNITEVEKIYKNIKDNHGFYIARYEAGIEGEEHRTSSSGIEDVAVSKKNKNVYNYISWSSNRDMSIETGGAVEVARRFSKDNEYKYIKSTLCYGVHWDAIMKWISEDKTMSKYLKDSSEKGNYSGILQKTGSDERYEIKNIYDMAGNVKELTYEAYSLNYRIDRGGCFYDNGNTHAITYRIYGIQSYSDDYLGFRIVLYY